MKIFEQTQPKRIDSLSVSGPEFISLVKRYITAVNKGTIPQIQDAWSSVLETQCDSGLEEALSRY